MSAVRGGQPKTLTLPGRLLIQMELCGVVHRLESQESKTSEEMRNLVRHRDYLARWLDLGVEPKYAKPLDRLQRISID